MTATRRIQSLYLCRFATVLPKLHMTSVTFAQDSVPASRSATQCMITFVSVRSTAVVFVCRDTTVRLAIASLLPQHGERTAIRLAIASIKHIAILSLGSASVS